MDLTEIISLFVNNGAMVAMLAWFMVSASKTLNTLNDTMISLRDACIQNSKDIQELKVEVSDIKEVLSNETNVG